MADNITQYDAGNLRIQPAEQGAEAYARAGRYIEQQYNETGRQIGGAVAQVGSQIGQRIQQHENLTDISNLSKSGSAMFAGINQQWDGLMKDSLSSDPAVSGPATQKMAAFQEEVVEPALQQYQDSATTDEGRKHALSRADAYRDHFGKMIRTDTATRDTHQIMTGLQQYENTEAQGLFRAPNGLDFSLDDTNATVDAHLKQSALTGREAATVKEGLTQKINAEKVSAAIMGTAEHDPDAAEKMMQNSKYNQYISNPVAMQQHIETVRNRLALQDTRAEREQIRQATQHIYDLGGQLEAQLRDDNGTPQYPKNFEAQVHSLVQSAPPEIKREAFELGKQLTAMGDNSQAKIAKMNAATNNLNVIDDFNRREMLGDGDEQKLTLTDVMRARNDGQITDKAFKQYKADLKALSSGQGSGKSDLAAFNKSAAFFKSSITKSSLQMTDGPGDIRYGEFYQDMKEAYFAGRAAGKTPDQLLNTRSPDSIYGQNGSKMPDYQFDKAQQRENNKTAIHTGMSAIPEAPVQGTPDARRKDGESLDAWAARVKSLGGSKP